MNEHDPFTHLYDIDGIIDRGNPDTNSSKIIKLIHNITVLPTDNIEEINPSLELLKVRFLGDIFGKVFEVQCSVISQHITPVYESFIRDGVKLESRLVILQNGSQKLVLLALLKENTTNIYPENLKFAVSIDQNKSGVSILEIQYDEGEINILQTDKTKSKFVLEELKKVDESMNPRDYKVIFKKLDNGKFQLVDSHGRLKSDKEFDSVNEFHDGIASVRIGSEYRFIRINGTFVPGSFESVRGFSEGFAAVQISSGKWKIIDTQGRFIKGIFKSAESFSGGVAEVIIDKKVILIDYDGNRVRNRQKK